MPIAIKVGGHDFNRTASHGNGCLGKESAVANTQQDRKSCTVRIRHYHIRNAVFVVVADSDPIGVCSRGVRDTRRKTRPWLAEAQGINAAIDQRANRQGERNRVARDGSCRLNSAECTAGSNSFEQHVLRLVSRRRGTQSGVRIIEGQRDVAAVGADIVRVEIPCAVPARENA